MKKVLILGCVDITEPLISRLCADGRCVSEICLASRDKNDCNKIKNEVKTGKVRIVTAGIDVTNTDGAMMMAKIFGPDLIINLMPKDVTEHVLCLALNVGAAYLDFRIDDVPEFPKEEDLLGTQFKYFAHFKGQGVTAVTGCGYDPALLATCIRNANGADFDKIDSVDFIKEGKDDKIKIEAEEEEAPEEPAPDVLLYREHIASEEEEEEKVEEEVPEEGVGAVMLQDGHMKYVADTKPEKEGSKYYRLVTDVAVTDFIKEFPDFKNVRCIRESQPIDEPKAKKPKKEDARKVKKRNDLIAALEGLGLMSEDPVTVGDVQVVPKEVLKACLPAKPKKAPKKKAPSYPDVKDLPVVAIRISGTIGGKKKTIEYKVDNPDLKDVEMKVAVAAAKMMCLDRWVKPGVYTTARFPNADFMDMLAIEGVKFVSEEITSE
ncbi:MAG: saccharopine dehydrogenase NADP-binding domain-containing protein [Clostridiales bacterium]|nr:saccharopine dehydrogenase NADP-binding domain-containing protein [Clostridiales bacterium]MBO4579605.1 saccharopine dehydrogenase NADP-binding domain-containing protein [Clostridiales bacterium]